MKRFVVEFWCGLLSTFSWLFLALGLISCLNSNSLQVSGYKGTVFQFSHELVLSSGGIKVRWTTKDPEWITFEISSPTKGYIGLGFSETGTMAGSDIYIGWVDSLGTAHVKDYFAQTNGAPVLDPQQDVELLAASENEHGTMIVFRRKWDTCDTRDYVIGDDTIFLLWAWSPDDPTPGAGSDKDFNLSYHGSNKLSRGSRPIRMTSKQIHWKFPDDEEKYPAGIHQYDFVNTNVQVPKAETYHHCKIIKFPQLEQKQHVLAYRILFAPESGSSLTATDDNGGMEHIHRVLLHKCQVPEHHGLKEAPILEKYVDLAGWQCYNQAEYPADLQTYCSHTTIAILGRGYEGFKYPDHVGVEIGDTTKETYYRLEIHYENPEGLYMIDNSGVRIYYSSSLRESEAGILVTGHRRSPFMTIPPHQAEFNIYGICSAECLWNGLNPEATKIVAVHLHTHSTGKRAKLKHIRNGKELPPIMLDNHLKYNHQDYRLMPREVKIMPGDHLVVQCTYETIENDTITFGGSGSVSEEICEATLIYYPRGRLTDCRSQPELFQYLGAVGVMNATGDSFHKINVSYSPDINWEELSPVDDAYLLEESAKPAFSDVLITSPHKLKNRFLYDYMARLNWGNDFFSKIVEQKWKNGLHYLHCTGNGGRKIPTSSHVIPYPVYEDYTIAAQQPDKCFRWGSGGATSLTLSKLASLLILMFAIRLVDS